MDAKEIVTLVKALNKAQAAGEPGPAIVDILEKLKAGVKATEELLRVRARLIRRPAERVC